MLFKLRDGVVKVRLPLKLYWSSVVEDFWNIKTEFPSSNSPSAVDVSTMQSGISLLAGNEELKFGGWTPFHRLLHGNILRRYSHATSRLSPTMKSQTS